MMTDMGSGDLDPLEKIIRPIVEGQIRGFLKEHPPIVAAVDWYKPRTTPEGKATTFTNSLSKRIVRDLVCPTVRARMAEALLPATSGAQPKSRVALPLRRWWPIWNLSWVGHFRRVS